MGLQELFACRSAHLRRYYTQQIILDSNHVYCGEITFIHDDLQRTGKLLCFFSFPMEADTDGHIMKYERRLREHC